MAERGQTGRPDKELLSGTSDSDPTAGSDSTPLDLELGAAVVIVSSSRTIDTDEGSARVADAVEGAGHAIVTRERIDTNFDTVQSTISRLIDRDDADFVVTVGGTGLEPSDVTIEAARPIIDSTMPAFGHLFTTIAYERIGTRIVSGRTIAGITDGVPVFCLPGNPDAAQLAIEEIVVPEIERIVAEAALDEERDADGEDSTDDEE